MRQSPARERLPGQHKRHAARVTFRPPEDWASSRRWPDSSPISAAQPQEAWPRMRPPRSLVAPHSSPPVPDGTPIAQLSGPPGGRMAEFVLTRQDDQLFGETEFTLREKALRMGAQALEATVNDRKEGVPRQQHRLCRLWPRRALPGLAVAEHHELDGADRRRGGLLSLPALPLGPQATSPPTRRAARAYRSHLRRGASSRCVLVSTFCSCRCDADALDLCVGEVLA